MRAAIVRRRTCQGSEAGISLIELMIAGVVLVVGVLAMMSLIITAIGANNRNKKDTTATMVAQMVMEQIATQPANSTGTVVVTDCASNNWTIAVAPGGATLSGGTIDYSAATVPNYNMRYVVCSGDARATYEIRWHVQQLTTNTALVVVGARQLGAGSDLRYFALPVTLRTIVGA